MATTINSRQLELDGSTVRDTTTDVIIASTGSEFLKQLDDSVLPNTITLSTTLTNLTAPVVYEWRYSNSVNPTVWNLITGQTGDSLVVTKENFATYLDTGRYVQFKVIVSKLGFISSENTYTVYQVKESDQVVQVLVNTPNILVPADSDGTIADFSGTNTELRVLVDGKALTYATSGANTFSVGTLTQAPANSITLGTLSTTATTYNLANISALTQDTASLTIPVTIRNSQGTAKPVVNYVQRYYKIKPGQSSVSCILTNDTHNIPTDAQGNNALYTGSGTQIFVYDGLQELVYDGTGTADGKWKVTAAGTNITPGTASVQGNNAVFSVASGITQDTASITFTITGKTYSGVAFSFTKVQTFSKAKSGTNPIIYLINTTSPVITKQAPNAASNGTHSSVIIRGKKYEGNVETNYGWITVTANGDAEQFPAIDTASTAYTLQPAVDAGKTRYTIRLYNQAAQSGATLLDTEVLDVVFKGESSARFSIDNAAATFVKDVTGTLAPANITLTTSSSNFTSISYQWQKNGVNISGATNSSYTVPSSDYSSVNTNTYKCNATGTINGVTGQVLSDTITIPRLDYGTSAPTVVLSNENSTFPAGLSGYTGITFTGGSCDITAYLGTTQLTYATTGANTFRVTVQTSTGATVAAGSGTGSTYSIAAPTAMSAETAYTDVTVVIRDGSDTALPSITRRISYSLSRTGATGATGAAAARFSIDNAAATFVKDATGTLAPANITLTTSSSNFTSISYQWQKNGVNISGATSSSYAVPSSDYSSVNTNTYKCNATGTINGVTGQVLSDTITIPRLDYGTSSPTVVLSNENITFPAALSGYSGITFTGGNCDVTAYLGTTQLTYAATGANTFRVTVQTSTGATVATGSGTGSTYSIAAPTAMSADTAYTDVTVVIRDGSDTALPGITRRISYSLSRTGATGAASARFSIDNAASTFVKDATGAIAPANITLTTSSSNFTSISYQWQKNGVNISGATGASYAVPSSDYSSLNTNTYKCNATGTINGVTGQVLSDTITIPRLDYGTSAPTIVLSNENSTFPAGLSGYTGITFTGGSCDITAYLGTTQLTYAATGANTFRVTVQTSTGATVATGSAAGSTYSIAAPTAMSAETAYTDVTIVIRDGSDTALSSITRRINYSLSRTGATGATGAAAARFSIDNAAATFVKDAVGTLAPANITLTTSSSNFTIASYQWQKNGVNISGATSFSYAVPSSDYSSVNTNTYKCNATGTINGVAGQVLSDTITIPRLDYGTSAPTVVLSNENSTFPAGLSGYTGITFTGGSCDITAYLGTTQLTYATTGANTFRVTVQTSTGATVAAGSGTGSTYSIAAPTAMSAETAYTDVTIVIRDGSDTALPSIVRRINYSLARTGATGATGNKSVTLTCFLWSSSAITSAPNHSSTLNWTNLTPDTYPATPAQWTAGAPAAPGNLQTLYQLNVIVTAAGSANSTVFNWNTGTVSRIGYRQDGTIGPTGSSARIAYIVTTSNSPPTTITADTGDNPPTGGWSFTATSNLTAGQYMYQVDGIYNPTTNATTWGNAYLSNLKVGQLSAISVDLGSISAGSININSGVASISNTGAAVFRSVKIQDSNGTTILESGGNLDFGRVGGSTKPANNATANAVGSGTLANRPTGNDGDFYFATDVLTSYQKVAGAWVTAANQTSVDSSGNIQGVNSGAGTAVSNDRVRAGGVNLVGNSGFLRNNGTLPTNWATYNNGGISVTTSVQAGGMFGQNYFRVTSNAGTTQTLGVYVAGGSSDSVKSWEPGQTYCISYWARGQGNAVGRQMEGFNSNMGFTSAGDLENPALTGSWQRYVFRGVPASNQYTPNGELYLSWRTTGTLASGSVIDICCPKVELGAQPSAWTPSPQDTLNQNIAVDGSGQLIGIGTGSGTTVANTQIAVNASGQITGIGTGVNTTVANSQIAVNASGQITGIGTGVNTTVANSQIAVDSSGNISGIGNGNGVSVANNQDNIIRAPGGGIFTTQTATLSGALRIRLPQFFTDTMMRFAVEIYEYSTGFMCTLEIGGYNFAGINVNSWLNVSARVIGSSNVEYPVRFGHDGSRCCVWIGNNNESWSYPQVRIRDFFAGYGNVARSLWESGWQLSFDTAAATNVTATVLDTLPGADWSKTSNRPTTLSGINSSEGNKLSGIEAGATVGATWGTNLANQPSSLSGINSTEGTKLTGIEAGATVGATAGTNLKDSNGRTVSDKRLLGNILDSTTWVLGSSGSQTGFPELPTSSTGANYIEPNTLPDGSQGLVWVAKSGNRISTENPEGGWNSTNFNIDHTKMYRFSVWIRLAGSGSTGNYYLGPLGSTVRDIGGSTNGNPYFVAEGRPALEVGIWYLVVGYVFPSGYAGIQYNLGGTYRATDGVRITASTDYRWVVNQSFSAHRTYQYYTTNNSSYQLFWNPRVELVDGSEASVAELLAMGNINGRNKINGTNNNSFIADDGIPGAKVSSIRVGTVSNSVNGNRSTGGRVDIDAPLDGNGNSLGGRIRIYDNNNALRLRIGYLL